MFYRNPIVSFVIYLLDHKINTILSILIHSLMFFRAIVDILFLY